MKAIKILLVLLLLVPGQALAVQPGGSMVDFKVKTVDGQLVDSAKLRGEKPLLLVFWATWCPACERAIGPVNKISEQYGEGLQVLGVNVGMNDSLKRLKRYVGKHKVAYPQYFDEGSGLSRSYGIRGTPTIVIVDRQGIVQFKGHSVPTNFAEGFEKL